MLGLAVALVGMTVARTALFEQFEQKTVDQRMRWRGTTNAASEIAICEIDSRSIDRLGQWPWSREIVARLIDGLKQAGARTIALDIVFSEPARCGPNEDAALVASIRAAGNVVPGFFLRGEAESDRGATPTLPSPVEVALLPAGGMSEIPRYAGVETPIPAIVAAAPAGGHLVSLPDSDGTIRHYPMVLRFADQLFPALALRAVERQLGGSGLQVTPDSAQQPQISVADRVVPVAEDGSLWVNFLGPWRRSFRQFSAVDLLDGKVSGLTGALVFVGSSETGIGDVKTTPFGETEPGVVVHATVADNLLRGRFIRDGARETALSLLAILAIGTLSGALASISRGPLRAALGCGLVLIGYAAVAQWVFVGGARHLFLFVPVVTGVLAFTVTTVWRNLFSERKAREIRKTFQLYVSPSIVDELLKDPDAVRLGGERREMTVLFSDIRGFTSRSEHLPPEEVVALLGEYLTPMTRVIQEHGGTLDKYMGDGIMAFFGAPLRQEDHAERAASAALAMRGALAQLNQNWSARGLPPIRIGIGLNSGPMAVGNMGSASVFDYTVIGDNVNLGSRLEGLTKDYGVEIIASESVVRSLSDRFASRELDLVKVRGKQESVRIFELFGSAERSADQLARFAEGLKLFRQEQYSAALAVFSTLPDDPAAASFIERCRTAGTPPATSA